MEKYKPNSNFPNLDITSTPKTDAEVALKQCLDSIEVDSFEDPLFYHVGLVESVDVIRYAADAERLLGFQADSIYIKGEKIILILLRDRANLGEALKKEIPVVVSERNNIEVYPDCRHTTGILNVLSEADRQYAINSLKDAVQLVKINGCKDCNPPPAR